MVNAVLPLVVQWRRECEHALRQDADKNAGHPFSLGGLRTGSVFIASGLRRARFAKLQS